MVEQEKEKRKLTLMRREKWRTLTDYVQHEGQAGQGKRRTPPITLATTPMYPPKPDLDDDV